VESAEQGRKEAEYRLQLQSREQQLEVQHINVREHQSAVSRQAMADRLADVERERASLELRLGEETQQVRALNERIRQLEASAFDADAQRRRAAFDDAQRIAAAEAAALQDAQKLSNCQQTISELTIKCSDAEKLIQSLQLEVAQCTQRADSMSVLTEPLQQQLTSEQQLRHSLELAAEAEADRTDESELQISIFNTPRSTRLSMNAYKSLRNA
jgi:chromosome segregation ATPase